MSPVEPAAPEAPQDLPGPVRNVSSEPPSSLEDSGEDRSPAPSTPEPPPGASGPTHRLSIDSQESFVELRRETASTDSRELQASPVPSPPVGCDLVILSELIVSPRHQPQATGAYVKPESPQTPPRASTATAAAPEMDYVVAESLLDMKPFKRSHKAPHSTSTGSMEGADTSHLLPDGRLRTSVSPPHAGSPLSPAAPTTASTPGKQQDSILLLSGEGEALLPGGPRGSSETGHTICNAPSEALFLPCACCAGTGSEGISGIVAPNIHSLTAYGTTVLGLVVGLSFEWAWDFLYLTVPSSSANLAVAILYPILMTLVALVLYFGLSRWLVKWKPCVQSIAATFLVSCCAMGITGVAAYNTLYKITDLVDPYIGIIIWVIGAVFCFVLSCGICILQSRLRPSSFLSTSATVLSGAGAVLAAQFPFGVLRYTFNPDPAAPSKAAYDWMLMALLPCILVALVGLYALLGFRLEAPRLARMKGVLLQCGIWLLVFLGLMFGMCLASILGPFTEQRDPTLPTLGEFASIMHHSPKQGTGNRLSDGALGSDPPSLYFLYLILAIIISVTFGVLVVVVLQCLRDALLLAQPSPRRDPTYRRAILVVGYVALSLNWALAYFAAIFIHWLQRATVMIFVRLIAESALQSLAIFAWCIFLFLLFLTTTHLLDRPHERASRAHRLWRKRWRDHWTRVWMEHASAEISEEDLGEMLGKEMERLMIGVDMLAAPALDAITSELISATIMRGESQATRASTQRHGATVMGFSNTALFRDATSHTASTRRSQQPISTDGHTHRRSTDPQLLQALPPFETPPTGLTELRNDDWQTDVGATVVADRALSTATAPRR